MPLCGGALRWQTRLVLEVWCVPGRIPRVSQGISRGLTGRIPRVTVNIPRSRSVLSRGGPTASPRPSRRFCPCWALAWPGAEPACSRSLPGLGLPKPGSFGAFQPVKESRHRFAVSPSVSASRGVTCCDTAALAADGCSRCSGLSNAWHSAGALCASQPLPGAL